MDVATEPPARRVVQEELWSLPEAGTLTGQDATALVDITFVVVDLETTGGPPVEAGITEIGAVKVRGGEVLGEFQTFVRSGVPIPPFISLLTGITDAMVANAPPLGAALTAFLEFAQGAVLVAHNAPYDMTFLRAACRKTEREWPAAVVVDTVRLARQVVTDEEAPNRKLASLARVFGSPTTPNHRALTDARATVDVLHGLIGRVGSLGVRTLGDLRAYSAQLPAATRRKRTMADDLPRGPGVYLFHDERGRVLYVGTSVDIRTRVRNYFTAAEKRARMREMVALAAGVTPVPCATPLEARVREVRLIAEHAPPYNRRSRYPERAPWLKLTSEPFPRLSVVREVREDGAGYLGPFHSTGQAELAAGALHEAFRIRRCGPRLPRRPRAGANACLLSEIGRCDAPCVGGIDVEGYAAIVDEVRRAMTARVDGVVEATLHRARTLAEQQRYEEAAVHRDRLLAFVRGAARSQRIAPMAAIRELVAARRPSLPSVGGGGAGQTTGGWELVLVRHGRLAGTTVCPPGADPMPYVAALRDTGEVVLPAPAPMPAALPEETELVLSWLEQPGVRLVVLDGSWASPVGGAGAVRTRAWAADLRRGEQTPGGVLRRDRGGAHSSAMGDDSGAAECPPGAAQ
jgi:DNA polymerase-3 subunit epsilon